MQKINITNTDSLAARQHQRAMEQARIIGQAVALLIAKKPSSQNKLH